MKTLNKQQMKEVNGGVKWGILALVAGAVVLVVGIFDGYTNPSRCNNYSR